MFTYPPNNQYRGPHPGRKPVPAQHHLRAALAVLGAALQMPTGTASKAKPASRSDEAEAWHRVERCTVFLTDPTLCPVALPLRAQRGLVALRSGRPAKRFVADGFTRDGQGVGCLVVPHDQTGEPLVIWADGSAKSNFKLVG